MFSNSEQWGPVSFVGAEEGAYCTHPCLPLRLPPALRADLGHRSECGAVCDFCIVSISLSRFEAYCYSGWDPDINKWRNCYSDEVGSAA